MLNTISHKHKLKVLFQQVLEHAVYFPAASKNKRKKILRQSIKQAEGPHAAPLLTRINFDGCRPQAGWPHIAPKR
jgi:hypothetical protein